VIGAVAQGRADGQKHRVKCPLNPPASSIPTDSRGEDRVPPSVMMRPAAPGTGVDRGAFDSHGLAARRLKKRPAKRWAAKNTPQQTGPRGQSTPCRVLRTHKETAQRAGDLPRADLLLSPDDTFTPKTPSNPRSAPAAASCAGARHRRRSRRQLRFRHFARAEIPLRPSDPARLLRVGQMPLYRASAQAQALHPGGTKASPLLNVGQLAGLALADGSTSIRLGGRVGLVTTRKHPPSCSRDA